MSSTSTPTSRWTRRTSRPSPPEPVPGAPSPGGPEVAGIESFRILGVDPGSLRTGWGLLGGTARHPHILECGVIQLRGRMAFPERLHALRAEFEDLVHRLRPGQAAVESPFHGANARSAFQLAHARGVLLAVLGGEGIPVGEYTPAVVKKAVTGNGRAEKDQVQGMILRLLGPETARQPFDVADALGVALCHAATLGFHGAIGAAEDRRF